MEPILSPRSAAPDQQALDRRCGTDQPALGPTAPRAALRCLQRFGMRRILDLGPDIEAAGMAGNHLRSVEDAHRGQAGRQQQGAARIGVRHGIVIAVVAGEAGSCRSSPEPGHRPDSRSRAARSGSPAPRQTPRGPAGCDRSATAGRRRSPRSMPRPAGSAHRCRATPARQKKLSRMKRTLRSTRPFSLPRYGAATRGSNA